MPIRRTFGCEVCGHFLTQELTLEHADWPAPMCPHCEGLSDMQQKFRPPAIAGTNTYESNRVRANKIAEDIAEKDYGVADMNVEGYRGVRNKVRYKDDNRQGGSVWGATSEALNRAIAMSRQDRIANGVADGLTVLHENLRNGSQPDLIEVSKKRSMRVW